MSVHRLERVQARRIAIGAQLLDTPRPVDLLEVVHRLTLIQLDPTAAVAPSADLVARTRLGDRYQPAHLTQALQVDRTLFEHRAMVRPMADLALYLAEMAAWPPPGGKARTWLEVNDRFHGDILHLLDTSGPLLSRDIPDGSQVPWPSTGWTNERNVTQMLALLAARGEIAIAGRRGRQRLWDLADRVYPTGAVAVPADEAIRMRDQRRLRSLGVARASVVGEAGEAAEIEGTPGGWRVDPAAIGQPFAGRTALLSPFDRLIHDRQRTLELFDFEYVLEMYKPKAQRRWGYFALPVLHNDRLVGKIDATAERKNAILRVHAIHQDIPFTGAITRAVHAELAALASWLGLDLVVGEQGNST